MKLTRVSAKDKSIGGTTHGIKWRYNGDKGEMEVPEKVGLTLISTGDFAEVKAAPKDKPKAKEYQFSSKEATADGITAIPDIYQDTPGLTWSAKDEE